MSDSEVLACSHVLPRTFTGNSSQRRVLIECPIAGRWVPTGRRAHRLTDIPDGRHVTSERCEACGEPHDWRRGDAVLDI